MKDYQLHIIDFLSPSERLDTIIGKGLSELKSIKNIDNIIHKEVYTSKELGNILAEIGETNKHNSIIIHLLGHGCKFGFANKSAEFLTEIIHWELLLESFKKIKKNNILIINLMSVCNSSNLLDYSKRTEFNKLYYCTGETTIQKSKLIYDKELNWNLCNIDSENSFYHYINIYE